MRDGLFDDAFVPEASPPLAPEVLRAMHGFLFCQGRIDQLPLYDAVHGIDDWELMTELFATLNAPR